MQLDQTSLSQVQRKDEPSADSYFAVGLVSTIVASCVSILLGHVLSNGVMKSFKAELAFAAQQPETLSKSGSLVAVASRRKHEALAWQGGSCISCRKLPLRHIYNYVGGCSVSLGALLCFARKKLNENKNASGMV